jgi:hypothetical protein
MNPSLIAWTMAYVLFHSSLGPAKERLDETVDHPFNTTIYSLRRVIATNRSCFGLDREEIIISMGED